VLKTENEIENQSDYEKSIPIEIENQSDYEKSIPYGRPLFAILHAKKVLEDKIDTILSRLLLDTGKQGFDWTKQPESLLSVLATRVQMGSTKLSVVSNLVAKGYANLTGVTNNFATFAYMPDPVCARLAMCMMDANWKLGKFQGKDKKWWSDAVKMLYSTGLCLPDKGDVGEVLTALYFLFCCDECRQRSDDKKEYTMFSVPLEDWIDSLISAEINSRSADKPKRKLPDIQVNFIQVCRNYLRSPWICLMDKDFLKNLYNAGTAFYTYPGCDLIDLVVPTVITKGTQTIYSSLLVSIKSRLYFPPSEAKILCENIIEKAKECKLVNAICIVCVFGQTSKSDDGVYTYDPSKVWNTLNSEEGKANAAFVLRLPQNDKFGLTNIFLEMTTTDEQSELLTSYSFLDAMSSEMQAKDALRSYDDSKHRPAVKDFENLRTSLVEKKKKKKNVSSCETVSP
jgi:hypothetical protein